MQLHVYVASKFVTADTRFFKRITVRLNGHTQSLIVVILAPNTPLQLGLRLCRMQRALKRIINLFVTDNGIPFWPHVLGLHAQSSRLVVGLLLYIL